MNKPEMDGSGHDGADEGGIGARGRMVGIRHAGPLPWVQLRNATFHTAIYRKMIGRLGPGAKNGDLVTVYDRDGQIFGTGMLNTQSQIGMRMLTFDAREVNESLVIERLRAAIRLRREVLHLDDSTDAYRIIHAEGDGLPGLIADRLGRFGVIELFSFAMYKRAGILAAAMREALELEEVLIRADERVQDAEGFRVPGRSGPSGARGERPADRRSTVITENGVKFQIDLTHGHKTGFFCDQRDNRLAFSKMTNEMDILDACCYSGGFGIYGATLGKAKRVTCVDLDEAAVALVQRNANINHVTRSTLETVHADVFVYFRQAQEAGRVFDAVVLDPPKLVPTRESYAEGRAKYFDMNKLALGLVKPGGIFVTCSCSGLVSMDDFFGILRGAARSANRRVQVLHAAGAGADHPVMTETPESAYLKCLWCRVAE